MAANEQQPGGDGAPARQMIGRYEILAQIAQGGMGAVYLARLEGVGGFQRLFAIKLMHPHLASEPHFISMLLDEARLAARIHHPNAVGILDVGECEFGHYLVMEYVDGFTLGDVLAHGQVQGRQRLRLGLRILADAMNGLEAAHRLCDDEGKPLQIVHRDVSPQNILVGVDGVGRITDFGVARAAQRISSSRSGTIKGKPCYMAPEQARGLDLDARADVFALGIVLWEVLTNDRLFYSEGGDTAALLRLLGEEIAPPRTRNAEVPEALERVCMKALERDVDARYQSAHAMMREMISAAQAADLLAPSHEVGEALGELFADKLASRRATLSTNPGSAPAVTPATLGSDVFDVPQMDASAAPGHAQRQSLEPPQPATGAPPEPASGETKVARSGRHVAAQPSEAELAATAKAPSEAELAATAKAPSEAELAATAKAPSEAELAATARAPTPAELAATAPMPAAGVQGMRLRDQLLLAATIVMLAIAAGFIWLAHQEEETAAEPAPAAAPPPGAAAASPQPAAATQATTPPQATPTPEPGAAPQDDAELPAGKLEPELHPGAPAQADDDAHAAAEARREKRKQRRERRRREAEQRVQEAPAAGTKPAGGAKKVFEKNPYLQK